MDKDPEARQQLARGCIERLVPMTDANYNPIREMLAAAEAAGFMILK
jgi:hypothetical protein